MAELMITIDDRRIDRYQAAFDVQTAEELADAILAMVKSRVVDYEIIQAMEAAKPELEAARDKYNQAVRTAEVTAKSDLSISESDMVQSAL